MMSDRYGHDLNANAYTIDLLEDLTYKRFVFKGDATKTGDIVNFIVDYK